MASIKKHETKGGKTTYEVRIQLSGAKPIKKIFRTRTLAEKWASQAEADIRTGRVLERQPGEVKTLKDAVKRYREMVLPRKAQSIQPTQDTRLSWWVKQLGHLPLAKIKASDITECRDRLSTEGPGGRDGGRSRLKGGASNATVNHYLRLLHHLYQKAIKEWGWVRENPVAKVARLQEDEMDIKPLTPVQRQALLEAARETDITLYRLVTLLLYTGGRWAEIAHRKWADVDLDGKQVILPIKETKSRKQRVLHLVGPAWEVVEAMAAERKQQPVVDITGADYLFPSPYNPKQPIYSVKRSWRTALSKAKLPYMTLHQLRHQYASALVIGGISLPIVASAMGHATFSMVQRYSHLAPDAVRGAIEAVLDPVVVKKAPKSDEPKS